VQVTVADVAVARQGGPASPLFLISSCLVPATILLTAIALIWALLSYLRRRATAAGVDRS